MTLRLSDDGFIRSNYSDDRYVYETYTMQTGLLANFNTGSIAHQLLFGFDAKRDTQRFLGFGVDLPLLDISNPDYNIELPSTDTPLSYNQIIKTNGFTGLEFDSRVFLH